MTVEQQTTTTTEESNSTADVLTNKYLPDEGDTIIKRTESQTTEYDVVSSSTRHTVVEGPQGGRVELTCVDDDDGVYLHRDTIAGGCFHGCRIGDAQYDLLLCE